MKKTLRFSLLSIMLLVCGMVNAQTAKFDFTGAEAYGMTLLSGSTSEYNADPYTCNQDDVTMTLTGGTRWWKASSGNELRFYKESSFTLSVPAGKVITNIVLNAKAPANFTANVGTYAEGVWTGSQSSVTISTTITKSNTPIYSLDVTYETATAQEKKDPGLAFSEKTFTIELGTTFTAPTLTKETDATVVYSSTNEEVATVNASTGAVDIVGAGTVTIKASVEATEVYAAGEASYTIAVTEPMVKGSYTLAKTIESGKAYLIVANNEGTLNVAQIIPADKKYGYIQVATATATNDVIEHDEANEIIIEAVEGGYTMKQSDGRYIYQTGSYNSFNVNAAPTDGQVWSIEANADGTFKITNNSVNKFIQYDTQYNSYGSYADAKGIMPNLYVKGQATGIDGVKAENNKVQVIYNLAGQRLAKAQKGLNIINGKKVVIK